MCECSKHSKCSNFVRTLFPGKTLASTLTRMEKTFKRPGSLEEGESTLSYMIVVWKRLLYVTFQVTSNIFVINNLKEVSNSKELTLCKKK